MTGPAIAALDPDIFAEGGQIALDETLATLSDEDRARVTPRLEHGPSRPVLRRAAEQAAMVVVGTRGHSTLLHRLLGSSVTYLLHHQPTAVVVVPAEADPTADD